MLNLTGYHLNEKLYQSANSLVYRARRESDKQSVIVKVLTEGLSSLNLRTNEDMELTAKPLFGKPKRGGAEVRVVITPTDVIPVGRSVVWH
jgi:hypothetical protein